MPDADRYSARRELLQALTEKTAEDAYPSATMLDMIEGLLTPDEIPIYAETLMTRIRNDRFPSISMMKRVERFA